MPKDLRNAVVVISGASSGIGEATAQAFAREGSRLVLASRNAAALEKVAQSCRELGAEALVVPTDVTDIESVRALAQKAQELGRIDVWVSNVGIGAVGRFHETPIEDHHQIIRANLIGHMNDAHAVLPVFLRQGEGVFINMISLAGFASAPFATAYSASKFGLRGFSEALRAELSGKKNIHICDIYPAFIDTPGLSHGANYVGRRLTAPPPVVDPRRVADAIVARALAPRPTTTVGAVTNVMRLAHLLAPNLMGRGAARAMDFYFRRAERVPVSRGNLYRSPADPGGIDGGLRAESGGYSPVTVATVAFAALLAAGALSGIMRSGRRRASPRR